MVVVVVAVVGDQLATPPEPRILLKESQAAGK